MLKPLAYDLHIHSCLSPCGDDDMTPGNIVGMAVVKQLDVIAVTDHNSCKNCPAVMKIAEEYPLLVIPGMELTTQEEVHVLCLFPTLSDALSFDAYVEAHLLPLPNAPDKFGHQIIMNEQDEAISEYPLLLISATDIAFHDVYPLVTAHHGIMIPAHIDKSSYSLISNLGFVPANSLFRCAELKNLSNLHTLVSANPYLKQCRIITDSDAHYLEHINEPTHTIYAESPSAASVLKVLCSDSFLSH